MKIIRVSTDNEISVHDFPEGSYLEQNQTLRKLIGPRCELYEHVMPKRLYSALGASNKISKKKVLVSACWWMKKLFIMILRIIWWAVTCMNLINMDGLSQEMFCSWAKHGEAMGLISVE